MFSGHETHFKKLFLKKLKKKSDFFRVIRPVRFLPSGRPPADGPLFEKFKKPQIETLKTNMAGASTGCVLICVLAVSAF